MRNARITFLLQLPVCEWPGPAGLAVFGIGHHQSDCGNYRPAYIERWTTDWQTLEQIAA
jgi:hypothetical protein